MGITIKSLTRIVTIVIFQSMHINLMISIELHRVEVAHKPRLVIKIIAINLAHYSDFH